MITHRAPILTEFRIIAERGGEVTEVENGYTDRAQAEQAAEIWQTNEFSGYAVTVEEY